VFRWTPLISIPNHVHLPVSDEYFRWCHESGWNDHFEENEQVCVKFGCGVVAWNDNGGCFDTVCWVKR
jgi:hypothetical protein